MLSALDETLLHQSPVPFSQTTVSDHRFFDRMWLGGHRADGTRFAMGMANYKNMNVSDGFFVVFKDGKQHNLRVSRPFLDDPGDLRIGPLSLTVVRPLKELRILVDAGNDHPFRADITFVGTSTARLEKPHSKRVDGRLTQDYMRFDQHGTTDGWLQIGSERIELQSWFGARDHSWGVRPNQGGYDPVTSKAHESSFRDEVSGGAGSFLALYLFFEVEGWEGYLQHQEDGDGKVVYQDGGVRRRNSGEGSETPVTALEHDLDFMPGTRACTRARFYLTLSTGEKLTLDVTPLLPAWCFKGTGYDFGFNDERGLGLHRGTIVESDVYDMQHIEDVILPDGRTIRPWQREVPCTLAVNGGARGFGYLAALSSGHVKRYDLNSPITNRRSR